MNLVNFILDSVKSGCKSVEEAAREIDLIYTAEAKNTPEQSGWISVEEFQQTPNEGWCWIFYKGRVVHAYHDHRERFLFSRHSLNCHLFECISHVMPWNAPDRPAPPEGKGE